MHGQNNRRWSLQSLVAVPPPGGSGTTARQRQESAKSQRYNRSDERYNRWENTAGSQIKRETLSLTPEEVKRGVMEVYVNGFPYSFQCGFPLDSTGSLRPKR